MDHWVEEFATRVNDSETNTEHKVTKIKLTGISSNWEAPFLGIPLLILYICLTWNAYNQFVYTVPCVI